MRFLLITAVFCAALPMIRANSRSLPRGLQLRGSLQWANDTTDPLSEMNPFIHVPDIQTVDEALNVYEESFLSEDGLQYTIASDFLKQNLPVALRSPRIATMDGNAFSDLIGKPWRTEEIEIFYAVGSWLGAHPNVTRRFARSLKMKINLVAMNPDQLREIVYPSKMIADERIMDAFTIKAWHMDDARFERFSNQLARTNVLVDTSGTRDVSMGTCHENFFKSNSGYCSVNDVNKTLIFRSAIGYTINKIAFSPSQEGTLEIQVSSDQIQWKTVAEVTGRSSRTVTLRTPSRVQYYKFISKSESSSPAKFEGISAYFKD